MILVPLGKLAYNVGDLGKISVATGFEWLPKVQKIAQSGHTVTLGSLCICMGISTAVHCHFVIRLSVNPNDNQEC